MRPSYRPAIPPKPQQYRTQVLDHLGLVAGMFGPNPTLILVANSHTNPKSYIKLMVTASGTASKIFRVLITPRLR